MIGCTADCPSSWRWWPPANGAMRSNRVVVDAPLFDQDASFIEAIEQFAVQKLVAELAIEAFTVTILPRASRFDVGRLGTNAL